MTIEYEKITELDLLVDEEVIAERLQKWTPRQSQHLRGYPSLYEKAILQADEGCDFDFLKPQKGQRIGLVEPVVGRS